MPELLFLTDRDVADCRLGMDEAIQTMRDAYLCKGKGGVEMPPKPGVHPGPNSHLHAMPAYISKPRAVGIKWIGTFPDNVARGMPSISGLIVLSDPETGIPLCVMDCRRVTSLRTGAKTALSARYLARSSSESVGIIGCGVQGRSNLEALACEFPIKVVKAYDVNPDSAYCFAEENRTESRRVEAVKCAEEAVRDMDIVVTTRPISRHPNPDVLKAWLKPGSFCAPIDYDSSFTADAIRAMDLFVTDDKVQFEYHRSLGHFQGAPPPEAVYDLGTVVAQNSPRRTDECQFTMAMNLGLGMDDVALANTIYRRAIREGIGSRLDL